MSNEEQKIEEQYFSSWGRWGKKKNQFKYPNCAPRKLKFSTSVMKSLENTLEWKKRIVFHLN